MLISSSVHSLSAMPLACLRALATASRAAFEVIVAPPTTSGSEVWPSTKAGASFSRAAPPMEGVSAGPSSTTSVMEVASTVTVAVTVPPRPWASPV